MDIVFGQLHLLMLGTELEAVPADTVSFELCIYSYLRASCVHSDRVCRLYSFIINVLLLFECRWSHSLQILLHVRNSVPEQPRPQGALSWLWRWGGKRPWHRPANPSL